MHNNKNTLPFFSLIHRASIGELNRPAFCFLFVFSVDRYDLSHFPTGDPLLALGTYTPSTGTTSSGYTVVFDKAGLGMAYITTGNSVTNDSSTVPSMTLSPGYAVNMNNIVITENAIPVTMSTTGYILDRVSNRDV